MTVPTEKTPSVKLSDECSRVEPTRSTWFTLQAKRLARIGRMARGVCWPPSQLVRAARSLAGHLVRHFVQAIKEFCLAMEQPAAAEPHQLESAGRIGYVIMAQSYVSNSVGARCLYTLCDALNRRGYPSFIVGSSKTCPTLFAPLVWWFKARRLCRRGYVAVYPESVPGNPLRAKTVARWVLNRPGLLNGDKIYDPSELIFNYSSVYTPYIRNNVVGKLYMPMIDRDTFYSDLERCDPAGSSSGKEAKRSLDCFYVGKSTWKDGHVDRDAAFEITRTTPKRSELGKLLRATRVLYCFDNSTMLIYEALMCGCRVVVIPDGSHTRADYEQLELGMDGMAWGTEELASTKANVPALIARYEQAERDFPRQLDHFVAATQAAAGGAGNATSQRRAA
jgi:hypothetical protein